MTIARSRHLTTGIFLMLAAPIVCATEQAQDVKSSPARLIDAEIAFESHVEFPAKLAETQIIIRCASIVSPTGTLTEGGCVDAIGPGAAELGLWGFRKLVEKITRAIEGTRAVPATFNGIPRTVWMNYSVESLPGGNADKIRIHEYFISDPVNLNADFVGPQRTVEDSQQWAEECLKENPRVIWVVAELDVRGKPKSVHIEPENLGDRCVTALNQLVADSEFTPAFESGQPVPGVFVEPFYYVQPRSAYK